MKPTQLVAGLVLLLALVGAAVALRQRGSGEGAGRISVYTAHSQEVIDLLLPRFEQASGLEVDVIKMGSGEVIQRVLAERQNPQCDVIWSIGGDQLQANAELLEAYVPAEWDRIDPAFKVGERWLPYTGILVAFVVNTELLSEEQIPRSWGDLARSELEGKIVSARADKSGSAYMQLVTVQRIHQTRGWEVYEGLMRNLFLSPSSSAVPRLVNDGEAAVGITLEDSAHRYVKHGGPLKIVYPSDGTSCAPDGIALVQGAPHGVAARAFIDWALSKETQDTLVREMGRRPVRLDAAPVEGLPPLSEIKTIPYDFPWAAAQREALVKEWTQRVVKLGL